MPIWSLLFDRPLSLGLVHPLKVQEEDLAGREELLVRLSIALVLINFSSFEYRSWLTVYWLETSPSHSS